MTQWSQFCINQKNCEYIYGYNKKSYRSCEILIVGGFHKDNQEYGLFNMQICIKLAICSQEDMAILSIVDMSITVQAQTSLAEQQPFNIKPRLSKFTFENMINITMHNDIINIITIL